MKIQRNLIFLCLVLVVSWTLPTAVQAQEANRFLYRTYNSGAITITNYIGRGGAVTIPGTINGLPVTGIGGYAFYGRTDMTSVAIPDSVTRIEDAAFGACGLTSVTIPDSVTRIGSLTFSDCRGLTNVVIGNGVTSIGGESFNNCFSLEAITVAALNPAYCSVGGILFDKAQTTLVQFPGARGGSYTIPKSVRAIGDYAFFGCEGLTNLTIPDGVTTIGNQAFGDCRGLTHVTIPTGVTRIKSGAFDQCSGLTSVTIPDSVTSIEDNAFAECWALTSVTIPGSVTSIGYYAFGLCGLMGVYFQGNAPTLGPLVFNQDSATVYYLAGTTGWGSKFGDLKSVQWNPLVPYNYATNNGAITITGYLGPDLSLSIPGTINGLPVTRIGNHAFGLVLTNVTIPDSVTDIDDGAFANCQRLASVTIPDSVTRIGDGAFESCESLVNVTIGKSVTSIGSYAFESCGLTNVAIPNSITYIGDSVFYRCESLTSVTIPDSVTVIGDSAFGWCQRLAHVTIPNSVTSVGGSAFLHCSGLTSVMIGKGVTNVGDYAFSSCTNLSAITVAALNPAYSSVAGVLFDKAQTTLVQFPGAMGGSYTIPKSVRAIGVGAFGRCWGLTNLTIPDSVTTIGEEAFSYCTGLTSLTIPGSVTDIGERAFAGSTLKAIYFMGNAPSESYSSGSPRNGTVYYLAGTTGWDFFDDFDDFPTAPWLPQVQTGDAGFGVRADGFGFNIQWADGRVVVVEAATNLAQPVWLPVGTNRIAGGTAHFADPQWTNQLGRFYRLVAQ